MNTLTRLDALWRDFRYAVRQLRLNPGFAIPAVLSLALGIGANTAVFQLLYSLVSRPLPVSQPAGLVEVHILSMVIGELGGLLAIGLAAGLALVLLLGRSVRTVLYGLDPSDAVTIVVAMLVLVAAAGVAAFVPARRAVQIDAGQSLRTL